jgi:hypothetical protein
MHDPTPPYDSRVDTYAHIRQVQEYLHRAVRDLLERQLRHDETKLLSPEREAFDRATPRLRATTYDSPEYHAGLAELGPALEHHYAHTRHHPQSFAPDGVAGMTLVDLLEMVCDWLAAVKRHDDGSILRSLEANQKRFGYPDYLKRILQNTAHALQD